MVKPKKNLGQHFLKDLNIAKKVALTLDATDCNTIIEVGAGTGALSDFLLSSYGEKVHLLDVDTESIAYLKEHYPEYKSNIHEVDFLEKGTIEEFVPPIAVIGNFPYNISSQIVFRILDKLEDIPEWGGMFQKEVAQRICASEGSKIYGILSVLVQSYYKTSYEFSIAPGVFNPPPKVVSGVMKATRYRTDIPGITYPFFKDVIRTAFNQRRKTLSNALKKFGIDKIIWEQQEFAKLRAEQLPIEKFVELALFVQKHRK